MIAVFFSCLAPVKLIQDLCDVFMAVMGISNMIAVLLLSGYVVAALKYYRRRKDAGIDPAFDKSQIGPDTSGISLCGGKSGNRSKKYHFFTVYYICRTVLAKNFVRLGLPEAYHRTYVVGTVV